MEKTSRESIEAEAAFVANRQQAQHGQPVNNVGLHRSQLAARLGPLPASASYLSSRPSSSLVVAYSAGPFTTTFKPSSPFDPTTYIQNFQALAWPPASFLIDRAPVRPLRGSMNFKIDQRRKHNLAIWFYANFRHLLWVRIVIRRRARFSSLLNWVRIVIRIHTRQSASQIDSSSLFRKLRLFFAPSSEIGVEPQIY